VLLGIEINRADNRAPAIGAFELIEKRELDMRPLQSSGIKWLPLLVMIQLSLFQTQVCRLSHSAAKLVARVGNSPTSSVCKTAALILS
jgi:hypothetical protein